MPQSCSPRLAVAAMVLLLVRSAHAQVVACNAQRTSQCCGDSVCDGPETAANCAADCGDGAEDTGSAIQTTNRCGSGDGAVSLAGGRCSSLPAAPSSSGGEAVLVWFHGSGGDARNCGPNTLGGAVTATDAAAAAGWVVACAAAEDGQWDVGAMEVSEENTCGGTDIPYVAALLAELAARGADVSNNVSFAGHSQGAMMAAQAAVCFSTTNATLGIGVRSFAQSASGLKRKGDGVHLPGGEGECEGCDLFPIVPTATDPPLLLCSYDAEDDPRAAPDNGFTKSSRYMAERWAAAGNPVKQHINPTGGHSPVMSWGDLFGCLSGGSAVGADYTGPSGSFGDDEGEEEEGDGFEVEPCDDGRVEFCCGDSVCDGPETADNCKADCAGDSETDTEEEEDSGAAELFALLAPTFVVLAMG